MFKHNRKKIFLTVALSLLAMNFWIRPTNADDEKNNQASYTIQRENSGGEVADQKSSFFDLKMKPGETRTIETKIKNLGDGEIVVDNQIFTAFTNINGEIESTSKAEKYDDSLKIKMSDIAKVEASDIKAKVSARGEKIVKAHITLPMDAKRGAYLGSWYFDKEGQTSDKKGKGSIQIQSKHTYGISIKITVEDEVEKPNMNLNSVTQDLWNYRKAFMANVQNDQPALLTNLHFKGQIMKKGDTKVLYENELQGRKMAPQSNYSFPIFSGSDEMKAGEYTYHLTVTTTDPKWSQKTWEWSQDFTVLPETAAKLNKAALNDDEPKQNFFEQYKWFMLAGVILVLLFLLFFLLFRKRKKDEDKNSNDMNSELLNTHLALLKKQKEREALRSEIRRKRLENE